MIEIPVCGAITVSNSKFIIIVTTTTNFLRTSLTLNTSTVLGIYIRCINCRGYVVQHYM
jgi:hypothetical protein